jgi:hypothetical protein
MSATRFAQSEKSRAEYFHTHTELLDLAVKNGLGAHAHAYRERENIASRLAGFGRGAHHV